MQFCYTDKDESESVVVDESSTEESESGSVHKRIKKNKEKDTIGEIEHEEPLVTDNLVFVFVFSSGPRI